MKLRTIRLENVRRFVDPVEIGGIGDGLNVFSAPNEHGKSTVFDALHAVFFKPRTSWDREIRSLAPHVGGDPSVAVEIELDDGIYWIEKRWSRRRNGDARIGTAGRLVGQADEAETWIAETLKAPRDGGPAGLLWVRQGLAGLDDGGAAQLARRDLLTSVTGEVEAMTGGRRMDAARDRRRRELDRYLTGTGRVKTGGPLKHRQDEVTALRSTREELAVKSRRLRSELDRRRDLRRELADLEDPEEETRRKERLVEARTAHADASRHAESLERAKSDEHTKRVEAGRAEDRLKALEKELSEMVEAAAAHRTAKDEAQRATERLRLAEGAMSEAADAHKSAHAHAETAAEVLRRSLLAEAAAAAARHREALIEKIEHAEELRRRSEQALADARTELPDSVLEGLDKLDESVRVLRRARDLEAGAIAMAYAPGRQDGVSLEGRPLPDGKRLSIPDGARLDIEGIGRLEIHPGRRPDGETLAGAEAELARALEAAGANTIADARTSAHRRRDAELRQRNAEADLTDLAPDGIDSLRARLAGLPQPIAGEDDIPTAEEARQEDEASRRTLAEALGEYEAAHAAHGRVQAAAAQATAAAEGADTRLARATAALSGIEEPEAERTVRQEALSHLRTELGDAVRRREDIEASAPDLEAAATALERARSIVERAGEERQRIRLELGKLDTSIGIQAGEAVDEELADIDSRLEAAQAALASLDFEVAVLKKLGAALEKARASARDRYVEPVMTELVPLLRLFWPEAELRFDPESLLPTALVRAGTEEDFDILSGGTQEQIALLVRLAFARMLARAGTPAPVILDDAIVYTDDDRIERMFDALTRQARDLQIVVFSCRQKAFRDLGGRGLGILPAAQSQDSR
ncbi:MAG: AAA family ATPase [Rhodospirillales bacterium]|nr:AAA family ATPase [Rhodospirillales bacterium]